MTRVILAGVLCAVACRGERFSPKNEQTVAAASSAIGNNKVDSAHVDTAAKASAPTETADSSTRVTDTTGTPSAPTPEEMRDTAIAFARREADCAKAAPDSESKYFHGARPSREFFPDAFCFTLGGSLYAVTSSGAGFRLGPGVPYAFTISVKDGFDMTFLAYRVIGNRIYFLYEITDSEVGAGLLDALDKNTLHPVWQKPPSVSFNVANPLFSDSVAYVSGINEVGKIRLSDGKFIWKHVFIGDHEPLHGLMFNAFDTAELENGVVRFKPDPATSPTTEPLVVDDRNGVIIAPQVLKGQKPACTGEQSFC